MDQVLHEHGGAILAIIATIGIIGITIVIFTGHESFSIPKFITEAISRLI